MSKKAKSRQRPRKQRQAERVPTIKTWALWIVLGCSLVGMSLAWYATSQTIAIEQVGLGDPSGCSINEWINCDAAHASSYANLFGIPVAWWGFLFYFG